MYTIGQLTPLLRVISRTGAILVGGQAINLWSERLRTHANSQASLEVQRKWRFEFPHAVPIDLWLQSAGPLQAWSEQEAPKWREEVARKIRDVEDIERWVRNLKRRPPGAGD